MWCVDAYQFPHITPAVLNKLFYEKNITLFPGSSLAYTSMIQGELIVVYYNTAVASRHTASDARSAADTCAKLGLRQAIYSKRVFIEQTRGSSRTPAAVSATSRGTPSYCSRLLPVASHDSNPTSE